jgi:hypothetical protein
MLQFWYKEILFLIVFAIGEIVFNLFWFRFLKKYFDYKDSGKNDNEQSKANRKILLMNLSTFKGVMERLILSIGLILGFAPILIVFGTLKLGTRFKDQEIRNDYFLIGNFSSILIAVFYYYLLTRFLHFLV